MLQFSGLHHEDLRFYKEDRCLVRASLTADDRVVFKRGMNYPFADLRDEVPRRSGVETQRMMTAVPCSHL
jgi:hypothetical protein